MISPATSLAQSSPQRGYAPLLQLSTRCSIRIPLDVVRWLCMIYRAPTHLSARCLTRWAPADLVSLSGRITCDHSRVFGGLAPSTATTVHHEYRPHCNDTAECARFEPGSSTIIRSVTSCRRKRRQSESYITVLFFLFLSSTTRNREENQGETIYSFLL